MDLKLVILFLFPVVIGSLGNLSLLCHSVFLYCSGHRSRSIDVIVRHLTVANTLFLLSRGIPQIMAAFGKQDFLNNVGCKLVFYLQVTAKGVSVSTTCMLSVFQAITISPRSCGWAELKLKAAKHIGRSVIMFWVLHMLLNIRVPIIVSDKRNNTNIMNIIDFQYCSVMISSKEKTTTFVALTLSHDILCLKLMIWSSSSMIFILYRHKKRTQHIHHSSISSRASPETRASQSILILVCTFVSFYALSSLMYVWFSLYIKAAWWLVKTSALTNAGFPTVSPFILMTREQFVCESTRKK
ncbi:vomeronasal 1 receptor cavPorV1R620 [Cavia porcellus]|uniref:vomeronasal 1 receptor cavPorV1R620 n=1 Tax=Cavia porcellus TaxID=10141 RepID=UPI0001CF740A|nr:vomeronasal 1 receptor cavPorV1R620 [Cavia porcellus]